MAVDKLKEWGLRILHFSSFKMGIIIVLMSSVVFFRGGREMQDLLRSLDSRINDSMFRIRGAIPTSGQVCIVDIDEKSLEKLGQWPWPRSMVGRMVNNIGRDDPLAIGFDVVFAEPDRTSLKRILPRIRELTGKDIELPENVADNDWVLGEAIANTPTIVGYCFLMEDDGLKTEAHIPCPEFSISFNTLSDDIRIYSKEIAKPYRAVLNIEAVGGEALSEGFFNTLPDIDGTVRRSPLFMLYEGTLYPSLTLEMLREGLKETPELFSSGYGIGGMRMGDRTIPLGPDAQLALNYRGRPMTFPYYSAADVIAGELPEGTFADKYVLIGTSATGLLDLRATPFSSVCPGVEVNATIIDNVLSADPMHHNQIVDQLLTLAVIIVGGILLTALLAYTGPNSGAVAGIVMITGILLGNYYLFFLNNQMVGTVYSVGTLVVIFLGVTVVNYFLEGRKKRFIQGAFAHYVSDKVVSTLIRNPEKLSLEGEEKVLTIMFSDIRGFTTISESMGAKELSSFLNVYMTAMTDIVMAHNGTVDKFIGDAIMAIWGAPLDDEEHARHGVSAALGMIRELKKLRVGWQQQGLPFVDIGVGLNSGLVSVGNMGSNTRFDYTVLGDNVNLASRLEGLNKPYGSHILISEATLDMVKNHFFCRPIDQVRVKGKLEPVAIYEPLIELPASAEMIAETARLEEGLDAYRTRRFEDGLRIFTELKEASPQMLYDVYLERIEHFLVEPPPEDWDGVYTFKTK